MKPMHTPGPWRVEGDWIRAESWPGRSLGLISLVMIHRGAGATAAQLEESLANARLIADAPTRLEAQQGLLEALQGLLDVLRDVDTSNNDHRIQGALGDAEQKAREAIAKVVEVGAALESESA